MKPRTYRILKKDGNIFTVEYCRLDGKRKMLTAFDFDLPAFWDMGFEEVVGQ